MIFGKKNKTGNRAVNLMYIDGLSSYTKGTAVELSLESEILTIKARVFKDKPVIKLPYEQIIGASVVSEKEILEKSKNVTGRAVLGGVILGPLGAIIGGMSGIGNKKKSETHYFMVINYKSKTGEVGVISFEIVGASLHWDSFIKELKTKIKKEEISEKEIYL